MEQSEIIEGIGRRSGIDFRKHEVIVTQENRLLVHYLKKPGTICDSIRYINTFGVLAVNGDYGNWIFCREFHPSAEGYVSDDYWCEKLNISSTQSCSEWDPQATAERLKSELMNEEYLNAEEIRYLERCIKLTGDLEIEYDNYAYLQGCGRYADSEGVIKVHSLKPWLAAVFDGFDEICRRMKSQSLPTQAIKPIQQ